jgi:hypothetical protein
MDTTIFFIGLNASTDAFGVVTYLPASLNLR